MEARVKWLRPTNENTITPAAKDTRVGTPIVGVAGSSGDRGASDYVRLRHDTPVVRNLRRGSSADASYALRDLGAEVIVGDLIQDRHARSTVAAQASWLKTWQRFHTLAFSGSIPAAPVLPVTPRSLVLVAALFKSGGYRAFPNFLSA